MTLTLHCSHCEQPMTIAPRKPGSRVTCPACGRDVTVPAAGATTMVAESPVRGSANSAAVAELPESSRTPSERRAAVTNAPDRLRSPSRQAAQPAIEIARHAPAPANDATALSRTATGEPAGAAPAVSARSIAANSVVLPKSVVLVAILFALLALALAFFAGFLFGRQSPGSHVPLKQAGVATTTDAVRILDTQFGATR